MIFGGISNSEFSSMSLLADCPCSSISQESGPIDVCLKRVSLGIVFAS